ncbi:MAG: hypothetical protein SNJ53_09095 [Thermodesulfovibrionales bacterium]
MSLNRLFADYSLNPFILVTSAYQKLDNAFALKRPDLPLDMLFEIKGSKADIIAKLKELKGKHWMFVSNNKPIKDLKSDVSYLNDNEVFERFTASKDAETQRQFRKRGIKSLVTDFSQPHNSINRLTGTTGEGHFAPYSADQMVYMPDIEIVIFFYLRDDIAVECLEEALNGIGEAGFGRDSSTGLGRFEVKRFNEIDLSVLGSKDANACYTLAPSVPQKDVLSNIFFTPLVRFCRHGDITCEVRQTI